MSCVGRCGVYGTSKRPQMCADYPRPGDFMPPSCTYRYEGNERHGECHPEVCLEDNCCNYPREGGEPEGKAMDPHVGGRGCKHLVWVENPEEVKTASDDDVPSITSEIYETLMPAIRGEHAG